MKRDYELVVLFHPDLEIDLEKPLAKVRKIIADNKGEITKEENWGKRKLAYRIKDEDFAVYVYFEISMPASAESPTSPVQSKLQSMLNITDEVLRYLLTAVDPRAVAAAKEAAEREASGADYKAKNEEPTSEE